MIGFLGEYEATLDAKGRFLLPGGLKKQLPEGDNRLIINRGFEQCLNLYPVKTWEGIVEKLGKLNDFDAKVRRFKLLFLGGATEVELDGAGRMLLPPSLKVHAGLVKDIVLACMLDKITIWDADTYKGLVAGASAEDLTQLAQVVMVENGISL